MRARFGDVGLVICLDSGAGNYDLAVANDVAARSRRRRSGNPGARRRGLHSGGYGGIAPSTFRIMRQLFERLEDAATGNLLPKDFHCAIPLQRLLETSATAQILGDDVWKKLPWAGGADGGSVLPTTTYPKEALLNSTWRPSLTVTGAAGLPPLVEATEAVAKLKSLLEFDPPYNAKVTFKSEAGAATG